MKADFEPAGSAAPKDGDFARYVEELVNRGYPAPGTVRDVANFDAARLLKRLSGGLHPDDAPRTGPPVPGSLGSADVGQVPPRAGAGGLHRGIPSDRSKTATGAAAPHTLPDLPVLAARATRALAGLASRLLLIVSVIWLALALIADVQFFANTIPIAMGLLFLSLYLRPGKPKPPRT